MKISKIFFIIAGLLLCMSAHATDNPFYIGIGAGETRIVKDTNGSYDVANTLTLTTGLVFL